MALLYCTSCQYRFTPKRSPPTRCPYCAREGTLETAKMMQDLIDEAELDAGIAKN